MENFYCDKCRILYKKLEKCKVCGELATKKIWIEVQKQEPNNK